MPPSSLSTLTAAVGAVLFLVASAVPAAHASNDYFGLPNTKCNGATLSKIREVSSIGKCKKLCDNYAGLCNAITFDTENDICYLKLDCENDDDGKDGYNSAVKKSQYTKVPKTKCADSPVEKIDGIKSLGACSNECDHVKQCEAVSFHDKGNDCYLLKECDEPTDDKEYTTLIRQAKYTEYNGVECEQNVHKDIHGVNSLSSCKLECDSDSTCRVANYDNKANICYLMESCEDQEGKNGAFDSAVKRHSYKILEQVSCKGDTLERFKDVQSFHDCLALCDRYQKCDGLTYDKKSNECSIKDTGCHNRQAAEGLKSAIRK